jgi:hypothetical protein
MAKRGSKSPIDFSAPNADAANPIVAPAPQPDGPLRLGPSGSGVGVPLYGTRRLRKLLNLSDHCDIEQVADDAASEIARLQKTLSDRPTFTRRREEF